MRWKSEITCFPFRDKRTSSVCVHGYERGFLPKSRLFNSATSSIEDHIHVSDS